MSRSSLGVDVTSIAIVSAYFGFAFWAAYSVFFGGHVHIYAENGLIETIQACLLAIACVIYLATAALEKRSDKLILLFCSLLCYGFALRELDVEKLDIPHPLIFIGSGVGRNITVAGAFIAICVYVALGNFSFYKKAAIEFIKSKPGALLIAGGVFLFVGHLFEKNGAITHHVFFEEMAELFGYTFIVLSSIAINSFVSSITSDCGKKSLPEAQI